MWSRGGASVAPVGKPAAYGAGAPMAAAAVPESLKVVNFTLNFDPHSIAVACLRRAFLSNHRLLTADFDQSQRTKAWRWGPWRSTPCSAATRASLRATGCRWLGGKGEVGAVALNSVQRRNARVSAGDRVPVGRFVPPPINFELQTTTLEIDFHSKGRARAEQLDAAELSKDVLKRFAGQVLTVGQKISFEYRGTNFALSVILVEFPAPEGQEGARAFASTRGLLVKQTGIIYEAAAGSGIKVVNQMRAGGGKAAALFKQKDFNFEKLGIGGLDAQFADIFRRAFASRVFPPHIISRLGITHVKGMLLHGPPGTGKTLIARQIGKLLNGMEPKVVNGPEILDKYVGAAEKNIRDLFADAEKDQKEHGDESDLHIIIFDEIDAICKSRGSVRDGTGVHDSIVNQLLTKIDGVESLNNILLIGMTNRKDMLDEALLRPGRLEVQIEIGLPDEEGRVKILAIHSNKMRENSFMGADVDLNSLAARTKNFSGAELEGLVKSAVSFALSRQTDPSDLTKAIDEDNIRVTMVDFEKALTEVRPAYGANTEQLNMYRLNGMLQSLTAHHHILSTAKRQVLQVRSSERTPLLTCLLEGSPGSGKTALGATIAMESGFPFVKMISAETMVGMSEPSKCSAIAKVFDDAYKSAFSIVILDDIERLFEYVSIGPRFSNLVLQSLLVLVKRLPPEGHKLYVIATTSLPEDLQQAMHLSSSFNTVLTVPTLSRIETKAALRELEVFEADDIDTAVDALHSTVEELDVFEADDIDTAVDALPSTVEELDVFEADDIDTAVDALPSTVEEWKRPLRELDLFEADDIDTAVDALPSTVEEMTIKKLLMFIEMASQGSTAPHP
ncbi:unnamed protein product [Closterium sp. Naga37s-1]|nr:unnamed protein product [Closterium sp. Naga37s-1]